MMKSVAIAVSLALAAPALAVDQTNTPDAPVLMTEAQLDVVVAGQPPTCEDTLLCVQVTDINVGVVANVAAAAPINANILGQQGNVDQTAGAVNRPVRLNQE